ncbi:hypothetical protein NLJ89_g1887 [Agrocybe chaxingu]|uniref:Uncharacterized protein n=1 Tax=Agrocybe chaxingu TaxID=84603 RepID=A0A9W8MZ63_9AGAR|nr:hypothetical protein NLJ89_g1887 [Agrocybe chaxingu]
MVVDVRRERLTEEFVKELIAELDECRREMATLREEHEKEMAEMAGDWRRDCRRLSREVERLKLAQDAYLWEQELSNGLEDDLMTRLALSEWRFDPVAGSSVPELDEDTETLSEGESEQMSIMSNTSTSTFVGSTGIPSPSSKLSFEESTPSKRRRRAQLTPLKIVLRQSSSSSLSIANSPHSAISSPGTYEPASYVGFSFNPIFFGKKKEDDDTPTGVRARAISLPSHNTGKEKASSQPKRVQWRF